MRITGKTQRLFRSRIVVLAGIAGLAVTAGLCLMQVSANVASSTASFMRIAQERVAAVQFRYDTNLANQQGVNALYRASNEVDADEFRRFVTQPRETPWRYRAIEWAVRVTEPERAGFEARTGITIKAQQAHGAPRFVGTTASYYPIVQMSLAAGVQGIMGFDLGSETVRRAALERAVDSGEPTVAAPLTLLQGRDDQMAFLVFVPAYAGDVKPRNVQERRARLKGVSVGTYVFSDNIEDTLKMGPPAGQHVLVYASDNSGALPVYAHVSRRGSSLSAERLRSLDHADAAAMAARMSVGSVSAIWICPSSFCRYGQWAGSPRSIGKRSCSRAPGLPERWS